MNAGTRHCSAGHQDSTCLQCPCQSTSPPCSHQFHLHESATMATAGLHRLNRPWQGLLLLQTTALPSTQQGLLRRRTRWISDEQQARSCPSPPVRLVLSKVRGPRFSEHDKCVIKIKQNSFFECNDPVRLVGTQPECLSSWNEASGPRPSIQVPGELFIYFYLRFRVGESSIKTR